MKKLTLKNTKPGLYISASIAIGAALMIALMIGMTAAGLLQTRKVHLIIQTETVSKVYDGIPLTGTNFQLIYGKPAMGHTLKVLSYSTQEGIGQMENRMEFIIVDPNGTDVTNVYDIEQRCGTLTVATREVVVRMGSVAKTYDGTPLSDTSFKILSPQGFAEGHTLQVYSSPEITEVGTIPNKAAVRVVDGHGKNVSDQYILHVEDGELEILPCMLTITTESASKMYDGTPLEADAWHLTAGDVADGHTLKVNCSTQITDVGIKANRADVTVLDARGVNVTSQYEITVHEGELTVEAIPLYLETGDASKVYDGTPLSHDSWQLVSGELNGADTIQVVGFTKASNVGNTPNVLTFAVFDQNGKNVTFRYSIQQTVGTLNIEPRKITVRTGSATKSYDGTPLTADTWELLGESLCIGHTMTFVGSSRTEIGTSENMVSMCAIYVTENGQLKDVSECYQITYSCGSLTVTP